jgi:hypothetical protein
MGKYRLIKRALLATMKETARRRITVTSSLNGISTEQLGIRVVMGGEALLRPLPPLLYSSLLDRYLQKT